MALDTLERDAIRHLHLTYSAEQIATWVRECKIPIPVLEETIHAVWPDDQGILENLKHRVSHIRHPMNGDFWDIRSLKDIYQTTLLDMAQASLHSLLLQTLSRYIRALHSTLPADKQLSDLALTLYGLFVYEYLQEGYRGMMTLGFAHRYLYREKMESIMNALKALVDYALIQKKEIIPTTFELPSATRRILIERFNLTNAWAQASPLTLTQQEEERRSVLPSSPSKDTLSSSY